MTFSSHCCERCGKPATYRTDPSGGLILEICRSCNPSHYPATPAERWKHLPRLIGFTGLAQAGKTTCANWMRDKFGFIRLSFAGPLKRMVAVLTDERDKDAAPDVLCGKTLRYAYQTLGTEWGRMLMGDDIWLRAARLEIERYRGGCPGLTFDDLRFDNELELIREMGGIVIRLERPGLTRMDHVSEAGVSASLVDVAISAETPEQLIEQLDSYLSTRA